MYLSLLVIPLLFGFMSDTGDSWQVAFCNIVLFGSSDIIHCDELQDTFVLKEGTNITIDLDNVTKTVTFSSTGGGGGINNTISSIGTQQSIVSGQVLNDHQLKGIACGGDLSCSNNSTDVTISFSASSDATTASNVGSGEGIFNIEVGNDLRFNSLIGGQGIDVTNTVNDLTIDTDFKIDTLPTIGLDQFVSSFNNSTGDWTTKTFSINTVTCSGTDRVSAVNNSTGDVTCSAGGSGIPSINGDTGAQTFSGTANQIILDDTGLNTIIFNVGTDVVQIDQSNAYSGSNTQAFGTNVITFNSDPADTGQLRLQNAGTIEWEASPTGTDVSFQVDANEDYLLDTDARNFNFNLNPLTNANFDVAGTGNKLTSTSIALGDILKSDGTDFKRLARGTAGQVLKVNAGGTDIEWNSDLTGSGATSLGADVTCASVSPNYCTVFTIPLTPSSGNSISIQLVADSNTAGGAIQTRARGDDAQASGYCVHRVYTSTTAETLDVLTVTGTPADTGETIWTPQGANVPTVLQINCAVEADASSPQNLIVDIQMEVASTGTIQKGSYYIKTP